MSTVIPVYFDYASSLCYVAWRIVARLEAELDVTVRWRPVHIAAQYPQWKHGGLIGGDTRGKIERVAHETGVPLRIPARWLDSRAALEGSFFAMEQGQFGEYNRGMFQAAYEQGEDIGERTVLMRVAAAAGLPLDRFTECLATRRTGVQLTGTLEEARRHGVVGYPTFLLGEFPLTGIQPFDTMRLLFERHIQRSRNRLH